MCHWKIIYRIQKYRLYFNNRISLIIHQLHEHCTLYSQMPHLGFRANSIWTCLYGVHNTHFYYAYRNFRLSWRCRKNDCEAPFSYILFEVYSEKYFNFSSTSNKNNYKINYRRFYFNFDSMTHSACDMLPYLVSFRFILNIADCLEFHHSFWAGTVKQEYQVWTSYARRYGKSLRFSYFALTKVYICTDQLKEILILDKINSVNFYVLLFDSR